MDAGLSRVPAPSIAAVILQTLGLSRSARPPTSGDAQLSWVVRPRETGSMRTFFLAALVGSLAGCEPIPSAPTSRQPVEDPAARINLDRVLRVKANATGEIFVEDRAVTPDQLRAKMVE